MSTLIIKLGAGGDVVRTTPLLSRLSGPITWIVAEEHAVWLRGLGGDLRCLTWADRDQARDRAYDLVVNLEDDRSVGSFLHTLDFDQLFGTYRDVSGRMRYTDAARDWFDLSLISRHGLATANRLKLANRRTYQDLIFSGLGFVFRDEPYQLPSPCGTALSGDVAISSGCGPVWPIKQWSGYTAVARILEAIGFVVNVLPQRESGLHHLADISAHRCLLSGDTLSMHLALGTGTRCVSLFNCTSPWEIHDYGVQQKIVSPLLEEFFYDRGHDARASSAIAVSDVVGAVMSALSQPVLA